MSKSTFERYHKNVIIPNQHRIDYLRLSNPFIVDMIFSPPILISRFIQLEKLVLDQIHAKYLRNILLHAGFLSNLHSLVISLADALEDLMKLWTPILGLRKLKYCKLTYEPKDKQNPPTFFLLERNPSPIEHLVLNTSFPYDSLDCLFSYLPQLRRLSINRLITRRYYNDKLSLSPLKHLEHVSLKLEGIRFDQLEQLIINRFHRVEVLRLTTNYDQVYLDAHRWEQLIISSMPKLHRFDFHHDGRIPNDSFLYHQLINEFNSPFWTQRGWHFAHQHTCVRNLSGGMFYSTDPYR